MTDNNTIRRYSPVFVAVLSAAMTVVVWEGISRLPSRAEAQITPKNSPLDAIKDRREIVTEIAKTNQKLDALLSLLKSGKLRVIAEVEIKQPPNPPRPAQ